jgi:hypothetical protein
MVLVKILKRKDASSVIVAVVVALIIVNFISAFTAEWSARIVGLGNGQYSGPGPGWKTNYAMPAVALVLELVMLEILGWIYVLATGSMKKK